MSETEANTGPPQETGGEVASEKKVVKEKKNVDEKMDVEEKKDTEEKKDIEENGVQAVENEEEGKDKQENEDASMVEVGDVNMKEATECENVNMKEAEDAKEEEDGKEGEERKAETMEEGDDVKEEKDGADNENKLIEKKEANGSSKKRARGKKASKEGEIKEEKVAQTKEKELLSTPMASSTERPVRERKSVERLVEVIEKGPDTHFKIEKGSGTPLKDIPNVAYKLSKKRAADLKLLHQILFGRRGKAVDFKNHLLQFSGFVWHENEEKQRARVKEKLDKYVKDTLLDLCDLFDIPVAKAMTKKEDLVVKLLDFLTAPRATTDVILADKVQATKSRKRKKVAKGSGSHSSGITSVEKYRKKRTKSEESPKAKEKNAEDSEGEDGEEEEENSYPDEDEACKHSESDAKGSESEGGAEADDEIPDKGKKDIKKSSKQRGSSEKEKVKARIGPKKASLPTTTKSSSKRSSSKPSKLEESNADGERVFSRKKKDVDPPKKKVGQSDSKAKATGKWGAKVKAKSEEQKGSSPSYKELREKICEILKEVDFNTATFTDILKQLATHYKMDLTSRKKAIKLMIREELTKLAGEAEDNEEEEDGGAEDENPEPMGKEVET